VDIDATINYLIKEGHMTQKQFDDLVDNHKKTSSVAQIQESLKTPLDIYDEIKDNPDSTLDELKQAKIDQLDYLCSAEILRGFDYTINSTSYHFSLSMKAQSNFTGTNSLFQEGRITSKRWTVLNNSTGKVERIDINKDTFDNLKMEVDRVVDDNISRFRDTLEPQVEAATSKDEVENIVW